MKTIINTLTVVALATLVFSCVLTLLSFIEPSSDPYLYWNFWILKQFRLQYGIIQLLGIVLVITSYALKHLTRNQAIQTFTILAIFCSINTSDLLPYYWPQTETKYNAGASFKLLISNLGPMIDFRPLLSYIRQEKPDIICIVENDTKLDELFQTTRLKKIYPYQVPIQHQLGLYSKLQIKSHQFESAQELLVPSLNATIKTPKNSFLLVISHPAVPLTPEMLQQQQKQYHFWQRRFTHYTHPLIIAGDMNSTPWAPEFNKLLTDTRLRDSQLGFGIQPSWGVGSLFQVPIDHVLVSKQFQVLNRKIGPDIGSDHRPVLVTLAIR